MVLDAIKKMVGEEETERDDSVRQSLADAYGGDVKQGKTMSFDGKKLIDRDEENIR